MHCVARLEIVFPCQFIGDECTPRYIQKFLAVQRTTVAGINQQ
jgi:hypothetical protein